MRPSVDVVVPVYGNWAITAQCLDSLDRQTIEHRVIVVDDKSPDDTLQHLATEYPEVLVVALERNSGFATACNRGIAVATADIVVLVNNDVEADTRMLEFLAEGFENQAIGSVSPLLLRPDGRIDAFGITADVTMAGFLRLHGRPEDDARVEESRLLGPYGAVAAYRRAALSEVGGLDEGIFMYGEELDLALRLNAAGWIPGPAPRATGVHLGGATSGRGSVTERTRAGFGRGYILRAYRVLYSRYGLRALATEVIVCLGDAILSRDFGSTRGRIAGWRAGRQTFVRSREIPAVDISIGFIRSLRLRLIARA